MMLHEIAGEYNSAGARLAVPAQPQAAPPLTQRLRQEQDFLQHRLSRIEATLEALESQPEFTRLLQLVQEIS